MKKQILMLLAGLAVSPLAAADAVVNDLFGLGFNEDALAADRALDASSDDEIDRILAADPVLDAELRRSVTLSELFKAYVEECANAWHLSDHECLNAFQQRTKHMIHWVFVNKKALQEESVELYAQACRFVVLGRYILGNVPALRDLVAGAIGIHAHLHSQGNTLSPEMVWKRDTLYNILTEAKSFLKLLEWSTSGMHADELKRVVSTMVPRSIAGHILFAEWHRYHGRLYSVPPASELHKDGCWAFYQIFAGCMFRHKRAAALPRAASGATIALSAQGPRGSDDSIDVLRAATPTSVGGAEAVVPQDAETASSPPPAREEEWGQFVDTDNYNPPAAEDAEEDPYLPPQRGTKKRARA